MVLGVLSGAVGVISIVSALTPSLANRIDLVHGVLPPGLPEVARWVAANSPVRVSRARNRLP